MKINYFLIWTVLGLFAVKASMNNLKEERFTVIIYEGVLKSSWLHQEGIKRKYLVFGQIVVLHVISDFLWPISNSSDSNAMSQTEGMMDNFLSFYTFYFIVGRDAVVASFLGWREIDRMDINKLASYPSPWWLVLLMTPQQTKKSEWKASSLVCCCNSTDSLHVFFSLLLN